MMGRLENFNATTIKNYYCDYIEHLFSLAKQVNMSEFEALIKIFLEAYENDRTIYFVGNGGSAATASHFTEDLAEVGRKCKKKVFKCLSMTDNVSFITAAGNDYGYDHIFVKQLEGFFSANDVLVSITASGNSPNVIKAINYAKSMRGKTVGLLGFDGGKAGELCDVSVTAKTSKGEYGPVEDLHMIFVHIITSFLYFELSK